MSPHLVDKSGLVRATHIALSEAGIWREIVHVSSRHSKDRFLQLDNKARNESQWYYINKKGDTPKVAQAVAIKFSDGSIWDNKIETWRI